MMNELLKNFCLAYGLGSVTKEPEAVTGGLMHQMFRVITEKGSYAIKVLNPDIMKRPEALQNMINSEIVSHALENTIPLIAAKEFEGKHIQSFEEYFFLVFDWIDAHSIYAPDITEVHCKQMGEILGRVHAANISIDSIQPSHDFRDPIDWYQLVQKANESNSEIYPLLKEHLTDLIRWDTNVVKGLPEVSKVQVISHRDLDPKNVLWQGTKAILIDWESAGYVNPYQELLEVLNYWISDESGTYDHSLFEALFRSYSAYMDTKGICWDAILDCSYDGMLGWIEYNIKRALGMEGSSEKDVQEGISQTKGTMDELIQYENQMNQLKQWLS